MELLGFKDSKDNFLDFVAEEKQYIDSELKRYFIDLIHNESDFFMKDFFTKLRDFIIAAGNPAKRTRPMVLIHSFFGIANDSRVEQYLDEIRTISLSIELAHNASIIHEDVVDQNTYRRGLLTFHKLLGKIFSQRNKNQYGNEEVWGNGIAIHGGDICAFLGSSVIMNSKFKPNVKSQALEAYHQGYNGIVKGKIVDHYLSLNSFKNSTVEDYLLMIEEKSSKLFDTAASIGAILADARLSQIKPLRKAINHLGIAYQIKKDTKSIDLLIKQKKRNILLVSAYSNASFESKKKIESIFNTKKEITQDQIKKIIDIIKNSGAIDFVNVFSRNLISQAEYELDKIYPGLRSESNEFFKKLFKFALIK